MTKTILTALIASLAAASVFAADMPTTASAPAAAPVKTEQHAKIIKHTKAAPAKKTKAKTETAPAASAPAAVPTVKK